MREEIFEQKREIVHVFTTFPNQYDIISIPYRGMIVKNGKIRVKNSLVPGTVFRKSVGIPLFSVREYPHGFHALKAFRELEPLLKGHTEERR